MKTIPYSRQFIDEDDIQAVVEALKSDYLTQGPRIPAFEKALAAYCGAEYCVALNSGTSALHAAYHALGLGAGDQFITSPITFAATSNAGLYLNAQPVFTDIEPDTGNIDAEKIERQITPKTRLLVPMHYSGHPAELEKIKNIADRHNLKVVEDACHAIGAQFQNSKIGCCKYSDAVILSFHPVKHLATGEGGAVLTNDENIYNKVIAFRSHGIIKNSLMDESHGLWYYEMRTLGYNYRITDIQAALGLSQLKKLDAFVEKRRDIAAKYNEAFQDNPHFDISSERTYAKSSYHLYPIRLKNKSRRREIFEILRKKGLWVQVHYIPVTQQPFYKNLGYLPSHYPNANAFYDREISIPLYPSMTDKDIERVINTVLGVFE